MMGSMPHALVGYICIAPYVKMPGTLSGHNSAIPGPIWLKVGQELGLVDMHE